MTPFSKGIIERACVEMMHSIEACHRRLFDPNHPTAIVLSGGRLHRYRVIRRAFP